MRDSNRWLVAIHEAGHAVMAHGLGHPVGPMELRDDGTGITYTGNAGELVPIVEEIAVLDAIEGPTRSRVLRERLLIALAGSAADHVLLGLTHWNMNNDREAVNAYCMALETPPWRVFPRVQALLLSHWEAIEQLATALTARGRLDAPHCEEILAHHMTTGCWLEEI